MQALLWPLLALAACTRPPGPNTGKDADTNTATDRDTDAVTDTGMNTPPSDADADGYSVEAGDCDDAAASVHPNADEACNGVDDDCDTEVDEGVTSTFYADLDGDGFGDAGSTEVGCAPSAGFVADAADCDDTHSGQPDALGHCATPYTTAYGSEMVVIDPGEFTMGAGVSDGTGLYRDHRVTLTHSFWIARAEVTQSQWAAWTDAPSDPSSARGSDIPIQGALWSDAARYANALSTAEGLPLCYEDDGSTMIAAYAANPYACPGYRLPTEAEWEYAARAGQDTIYAGSDTAAEVAWTSETSDHTPHDVCSLAPNAWTLCDMSGNVWEWTNDWFDATYGGYGTGAAATDPPGPATGSTHPLRGSGWNDPQSWATTSVRNPYALASARYNDVGFRVARTSLAP